MQNNFLILCQMACTADCTGVYVKMHFRA